MLFYVNAPIYLVIKLDFSSIPAFWKGGKVEIIIFVLLFFELLFIVVFMNMTSALKTCSILPADTSGSIVIEINTKLICT